MGLASVTTHRLSEPMEVGLVAMHTPPNSAICLVHLEPAYIADDGLSHANTYSGIDPLLEMVVDIEFVVEVYMAYA